MKSLLAISFILSFYCAFSRPVKPQGSYDEVVYVTTNNKSDIWSIYRRVADSTYYIEHEDRSMAYDHLRYYKVFPEFVQVLTDKNQILYIGCNDLQPISQEKMMRFEWPPPHCGNEVHDSREVEKSDTAFEVYDISDFRMVSNRPQEKKLVATIPFAKADEVYVGNHQSKMGLNYSLVGSTIFYKKNGKCGIWDKTEAIYDDMIPCRRGTKIKINNLYTYLEFNGDVRYTSLGNFERELARFELPNGTGGYVDISGKEYPDH